MTQDESTKTPLPEERFVRVKQILRPFKGDRWLTVGVYGAIATLGLIFGSLAWNWSDLQTNPSEQSKQKFDASLSVVSTSATIAAGIVLFLNFRVAQKKLEQETTKAETDKKLAESRLQMERFNKAVEMLGKNDSIHLRLGGIYALETIAADSNPDAPDEDYRQVLEVLTAFVRENAPYSPRTIAPATPESPDLAAAATEGETKQAEIPPLPTDIQAVLTVLNRRKHRDKDWEHHRLDLRKTDLSRAFLKEANLQQAILTDAKLQQTILIKADLQQATLIKANLQKAILWEAHLQNADLRKADLQQAILWEAHLQQANLTGACLQQADLREAHLQNAVLMNANFQQADLTEAHLQEAKLRGADLREAFLINADLRQTDLRGVLFQKASLADANLQKANLWEANLQQADLGGAIFWDPELIDAELAEAKEAAKANLQSARNWEAAKYDPDIREWLGLLPEVA